MTNKRILNIGCGSETYGTDFIDAYPSRQNVIQCDLSEKNLPYDDNTFDEVYSKNLLEHLPNPLHILKEAKRVLKKGGKLYFLTDNAGFFLFHIPLRKNNFLQHNSNTVRYGEKDRHYFLFTPLHLKNLIDKCGGFHEIKVNYDYASSRKILSLLKPILNLANKTFLVRLLNPHLVIKAFKQ